MSGPLDRYEIAELVAVMWNDDMAARFPNAQHHFCRQMPGEPGGPVRCFGWHCNRCGQPTNSFGHHDCPDRPEKP